MLWEGIYPWFCSTPEAGAPALMALRAPGFPEQLAFMKEMFSTVTVK